MEILMNILIGVDKSGGLGSSPTCSTNLRDSCFNNSLFKLDPDRET